MFQMWWTTFPEQMHKNKSYHNDKFQNYQKIDNPQKSRQNYHKNDQFPTATILYQASKQVKPGDDISLTINMIKHLFSKINKKYTLLKKSNTLSNIPKSQEGTGNEVMETITLTHNSLTDRAEPLHKAANKEKLLPL